MQLFLFFRAINYNQCTKNKTIKTPNSKNGLSLKSKYINNFNVVFCKHELHMYTKNDASFVFIFEMIHFRIVWFASKTGTPDRCLSIYLTYSKFFHDIKLTKKNKNRLKNEKNWELENGTQIGKSRAKPWN